MQEITQYIHDGEISDDTDIHKMINSMCSILQLIFNTKVLFTERDLQAVKVLVNNCSKALAGADRTRSATCMMETSYATLKMSMMIIMFV